ncbi:MULTISPECIES: methyltransferase [Brevundimonas]|uniref:methyltransferase n=1 Tax=Brevundimonas TaxID=41275 RepID=UPI0028A92E51|nr:methyltransferase [Brevundimonas sp.]
MKFTTPTPATHRQTASRLKRAREGDLRDVFGWGRRFGPDELDPILRTAMRDAGLLVEENSLCRSALRVSTLDGRLHLHSARGDAENAVFLGPDSYRFVRFLAALATESDPGQTVLDIGAGAGAGALAMAARWPDAKVVASDINPFALTLLAANAAHAGLELEIVEGSGPQAAPGVFDLIVANPPFTVDEESRTYRDGGGLLGSDLALDWVAAGLDRLRPGGRFALYAGSPIIEGRDLLRSELEQLAAAAGATLSHEELDPDIFGTMLARDAYRAVDRIAAVAAVLAR